jgi:hypothetical protein
VYGLAASRGESESSWRILEQDPARSALAVRTLLTNYLNNVNLTGVDFPAPVAA